MLAMVALMVPILTRGCTIACYPVTHRGVIRRRLSGRTAAPVHGAPVLGRARDQDCGQVSLEHQPESSGYDTAEKRHRRRTVLDV